VFGRLESSSQMRARLASVHVWGFAAAAATLVPRKNTSGPESWSSRTWQNASGVSMAGSRILLRAMRRHLTSSLFLPPWVARSTTS